MYPVYEPMWKSSIWLLQRRFFDDRYSSDLLKWTLSYLLSGLDYLHSECHVIHTGKFLVVYNVDCYLIYSNESC